MKAFRFMIIAAVCAVQTSVSFAQAPAAPKGIDAYPMSRTRNIFDPDRQPMATATQPAATPAPKASDYIALTGIMVSGSNMLAFFSGSRPDYDKVLPVDSDIAGAKLTGISSTSIEVTRNGKRVVVAVGQTVPFDDSPPGIPPYAMSDASSSAVPEVSSTSIPSSLPAGLTDVVRRMMERRRHELQ